MSVSCFTWQRRRSTKCHQVAVALLWAARDILASSVHYAAAATSMRYHDDDETPTTRLCFRLLGLP